MFSKNLKYYRLKNNMTKRELASLVQVTPMAITNYESGARRPDMAIIQSLADALGVRVTDFLVRRNETLQFVHGEFRKSSKLTKGQQQFVREAVEEYVGRFYSIIDILGDHVLPDGPMVGQLIMTGDPEVDAKAMRKYLKIAETGPVGNLVELLENRGVIVYVCSQCMDDFYGMNGTVNSRPYIAVSANQSPERMRSTIAHELAHLMFSWDGVDAEAAEEMATAISGAFLFPAEDVVRELGVRRTQISKDMAFTCKEYGISMYLLVKRASICKVISQSIAKDFYIRAGKLGWRKSEPSRIQRDPPTLFAQLVYRAVSEEEISVQRGAELLCQSYDHVLEQSGGLLG